MRHLLCEQRLRKQHFLSYGRTRSQHLIVAGIPSSAVLLNHSVWRDDRNASDTFQIERKIVVMKIGIGIVLSFLIGAGCRYFDIPAASPPVIPGALLVLAMTLGYSSMDRLKNRRERVATTKEVSGGPTGLPVTIAQADRKSE